MKRFIIYLLALLGFGAAATSCAKAMYGTPHVAFRVTARVVDEAGEPVEGIRVAMYHEWREGYEAEDFEYRTGYTDYEGNIDATATPVSLPDKLIVEDVDGEANGGEFASQIIAVESLKQTEKGDGNWYDGAYEAHLGEITLEHKTANDEEQGDEEF